MDTMNARPELRFSVSLPRYNPAAGERLQSALEQSLPGAEVSVNPKEPDRSGGGRGKGGGELGEALYQVIVWVGANKELIIAAGAYAGKKLVDVVADITTDWLRKKRRPKGKRRRILVCDDYGQVIRSVDVDP